MMGLPSAQLIGWFRCLSQAGKSNFPSLKNIAVIQTSSGPPGFSVPKTENLACRNVGRGKHKQRKLKLDKTDSEK